MYEHENPYKLPHPWKNPFPPYPDIKPKYPPTPPPIYDYNEKLEKKIKELEKMKDGISKTETETGIKYEFLVAGCDKNCVKATIKNKELYVVADNQTKLVQRRKYEYRVILNDNLKLQDVLVSDGVLYIWFLKNNPPDEGIEVRIH